MVKTAIIMNIRMDGSILLLRVMILFRGDYPNIVYQYVFFCGRVKFYIITINGLLTTRCSDWLLQTVLILFTMNLRY